MQTMKLLPNTITMDEKIELEKPTMTILAIAQLMKIGLVLPLSS